MSSLLLSASPLDENNNIINQIEKKKINNRNKTIKKRMNTDKIDKVMRQIHDNDDDYSNSNLGDFNPLPKPVSIGAVKREELENRLNNSNHQEINENEEQYNNIHRSNYDNSDIPVEKENFQSLPSNYTQEYYNHIMSNYNYNSNNNNNNIQPYTGNVSERMNHTSNDELLNKLNYMIHLLEEQQEIKTSNITEEIILYSFLGIFIIFVLDSFARAGKYVR